MQYNVCGLNEQKIKNFQIQQMADGSVTVSFDTDAKCVLGLGERFDTVNHFGKIVQNSVFEKFTHQGEKTYFPLPFFLTEKEFGMFVDSNSEMTFDFSSQTFKIHIDISKSVKGIYFFHGSPKEIIAQFVAMTGEAKIPPKWCFGIFISANRWNNQHDVMQQLDIINKSKYPATACVLEAWSDETTFYKWNGSKLLNNSEDKALKIEDFEFHEPWKNPKSMIDEFHKNNIKVILWQIPALKKFDEGEYDKVHEKDIEFAVQNKLVGFKANGESYEIPRQWFIGAKLPDFTNPNLTKWWFSKRQYLLDMGIDGFKTDGGEFIHDYDVNFAEGNGRLMRNRYSQSYVSAYNDFVGKERVLFSRSGYIGAQTTPIHWAGDQMSEFSELSAQLVAGLSLSLCGLPFWSFDIGGFAGKMPTAELYLRATQMAVFSPIMQWHSEPTSGQFDVVYKNTEKNNDRSPWNMAKFTKDSTVLDVATFYANLRLNLFPYIFSEAKKAVEKHETLMQAMCVKFPCDENTYCIFDQYMFGDLLIAPILKEGQTSREVYFPSGKWINIFTKEIIEGGAYKMQNASRDEVLVYLMENSAIVLNLKDSLQLGENVGNALNEEQNLVVMYFGDNAMYDYVSDDLCFSFEKGKIDKSVKSLVKFIKL